MRSAIDLHVDEERDQARRAAAARFLRATVAHLRAIRDLCVGHPMDDLVLDRATDLLASTQARGRDAFIAATALLAGFDAVVTTDDRFVEVPGLRRVHPRELTSGRT